MTTPTVDTHVDELRVLEAEAVHIIREVVAELQRPVLLFSAAAFATALLVPHITLGRAREVPAE